MPRDPQFFKKHHNDQLSKSLAIGSAGFLDSSPRGSQPIWRKCRYAGGALFGAGRNKPNPKWHEWLIKTRPGAGAASHMR